MVAISRLLCRENKHRRNASMGIGGGVWATQASQTKRVSALSDGGDFDTKPQSYLPPLPRWLSYKSQARTEN